MKKIFFILVFYFLIINSTYAQDSLRGLVPAALPNMSYSSEEGLEYGGIVYLFQYGNGTIKPYKWSTILNCTWSTKHKHDIYFFLDIPEIIGKDSRFDIYLESQRYIYNSYYGVGNDNTIETAYTEKTSVGYINSDYYDYQRRYFSVRSKLQFALGIEGLKGLAGLGFYNTKIDGHDGLTKFSQDAPFGSQGGTTNYCQLGVVFDRRDEEAVTTRGFWSEILFETAAPFLGSDYTYSRITATDRRYFSIHPRIVYAQRLLFETMPGNPPFYEMGVISSSHQRRPGLGGSYNLRGMPKYMLLGPTKFVANFEMRFRTIHVNILKQDFTLFIHPFIDCGKVWQKNDAGNLTRLHITEGLGFHVRWNKDFVGALDFGHSQYESLAIYMSFGNMF